MDAYSEDRFVVSGGTGPERVGGALASAGLFRTLGVQPTRGRAFIAEDERLSSAPVVVISDTLWRRRFSADSGVLGATLRVNGIDRVIIGVMPPRFAFPEYAEFWMPIAPAASAWSRANRSLGVVARLRPGVVIEKRLAELLSRRFVRLLWRAQCAHS
jgi:hypothetical protein